MASILIVDDEPEVLAALRRALRQQFGAGLSCETCSNGIDALGRAREQRFDVVMADLHMPELDGIGLLTLIAAIQPDAVRMMMTGANDFETAQRAINEAGVFRYLCKPWTPQELASHLTAALAQAASCQRALDAGTRHRQTP
ncbi:MAG: hypothetical protein C0505_00215 [Leptothrix sp. (in: Bacteria)]|nr:hypothetical protein [Leptothrix sp. (in: b-proteobacteria)]